MRVTTSAAIHGLVRRLRDGGLPVSPAEALDALQAAGKVGLESRERLRAALQVTLVKDARGLAAFQAAFEAHFRTPRAGSGRRRGGAGAGSAGEGGSRRHDEPGGEASGSRSSAGRSGAAPTSPSPTGGGAGDAGSRRPLSRWFEQLARSREARLRRVVLRPERASGAAGAVRAELTARRPGGTRRDRASGSAPGQPPWDPRAGGVRLKTAPGEAGLTSEDEALLALHACQALGRLRTRRARRRRGAWRGAVAPRATWRRTAATDGVPFRFRRERRRRRPPRTVLLLDVSHSVARSTGLFLLLAAELVERSGAEVYLFVDRPLRVTTSLRAWLRGRTPTSPSAVVGSRPARGQRFGSGFGSGIRARPGGLDFASWLAGVEDLDLTARSDYGRALYALADSAAVRRGDLLVVLGDGRTNAFDPQAWALEELGERAVATVWLVSEPRAEWGSGDSALAAYLPQVDVAVEAADLDGLVAGLRELQAQRGS